MVTTKALFKPGSSWGVHNNPLKSPYKSQTGSDFAAVFLRLGAAMQRVKYCGRKAEAESNMILLGSDRTQGTSKPFIVFVVPLRPRPYIFLDTALQSANGITSSERGLSLIDRVNQHCYIRRLMQRASCIEQRRWQRKRRERGFFSTAIVTTNKPRCCPAERPSGN